MFNISGNNEFLCLTKLGLQKILKPYVTKKCLHSHSADSAASTGAGTYSSK